MSGDAPIVYIIVLNWHGWRDTLDCLDSLLSLTYARYAVVIVDNASGDESLSRIVAWAASKAVPLRRFQVGSQGASPKLVQDGTPRSSGFMNLDLISSQINTGYCIGNNIGMAHSVRNGADYLFVLNNDTIAQCDVLEHLVTTAQKDPMIGLLSPLICYATESDVIWWGGGSFGRALAPVYLHKGQHCSYLQGCPPQHSDWASGCAMLMPRAIFEAFNGFDERFFIWCDEWDLSIRVRKAGFKIKVVPQAKVHHKVGRALEIVSPLTFFYSARNMLILRKKHLSRLQWLPALLLSIPLKCIQALYFSLKFRNLLYLYGFVDIVREGPGKGGGIWSRQTG